MEERKWIWGRKRRGWNERENRDLGDEKKGLGNGDCGGVACNTSL
jgi:hypothetical protein